MIDNRTLEADKAARIVLESRFKREVLTMIIDRLPVEDDRLMEYIYELIMEWDK